MSRQRALFVASPFDLRGQGGVQVCTAEYIQVLEAAGFDLEIMTVEQDRGIDSRILRKLGQSPYFRTLSRAAKAAIKTRSRGVGFLFANQMNLAGPIAAMQLPGVRVIGLSHGCEITDQVHLDRLYRSLPLTRTQLRPHPALALARTLRDEIAARKHLSAVIAISPFDADSERWLGTRQVCWIPRTVVPSPLDRSPIAGRYGYVGTLDHGPNLEGLVAVIDEIERSGITDLHIRVIGGPTHLGQWLTARSGAIEYLGPLSDEGLILEAASWNGFVHPIFCLPRGCSTKLAGGLSWAMPIVTTAAGRRGYQWREGGVIEVDTPRDFVLAMQSLMEQSVEQVAAKAVWNAVNSAPTIDDVATMVARFIAGVGNAAPQNT